MMLLPLYVHPIVDPAAWEAVWRYPDGVTVIVNVHNGPGADPAYDAVLDRLRRSWVRMLGYVDLDYGARPIGEVWSDVVGWCRYRTAGVFFDRVPSAASALGYVAQAVRAVRGTVALNPGTTCAPGYAALAELVCTYEGPWSSYVDLVRKRDLPGAAHLVYGVPSAELGRAAALLSSRAGHGLVTDLDMPLPYAGLPSSLRDRAAAW
jgi:hypothetical protein